MNPSPSFADGLSAGAGRDAHADGPTGGRLRRLIAMDAAGMAVVGVVYLAAASPLGSLFGPGTVLVAVVGAAMLAAGAGIALVARLRPLPPGAVFGVIGGGVFWILLSLAALALGLLELTTTGLVWTWLQILPVAVFASLQALGLRAHLHAR
ncbi:hypothetical protein ABZO31_28275 [Streptomyces sp. HUAS MG47]|uniref:hypothetical protein n=1 Tax=Streptomyces solicamelliae TaxID=3231716 RepID=UPI00387832DA